VCHQSKGPTNKHTDTFCPSPTPPPNGRTANYFLRISLKWEEEKGGKKGREEREIYAEEISQLFASPKYLLIMKN
jgi:hypothetical protein